MSEGVSEKKQQSTECSESWSLGQENLATTDPLLGRNIPKASTFTSPPPSTVLSGLPLPDPAEARGKARLEALWDVNCFLSLRGCGALCCKSRPPAYTPTTLLPTSKTPLGNGTLLGISALPPQSETCSSGPDPRGPLEAHG